MKFEIVIIEEGEKSRINLKPGEKVILGRSSSATHKLSDSKISGKHCEIFITGDEVKIVDLDTTNGTFLNGESIVEAFLDPEDQILLGKVQIKLLMSEKTRTHVTSVQEKMKRRIIKNSSKLAKQRNSQREEQALGTGVYVDRKFELEEESGNTKFIQLEKVKTEKKVIKKIAPREETKIFDKIKGIFSSSDEEDEE